MVGVAYMYCMKPTASAEISAGRFNIYFLSAVHPVRAERLPIARLGKTQQQLTVVVTCNMHRGLQLISNGVQLICVVIPTTVQHDNKQQLL